jgi:outer membrane protein insertion porin family
LRRLVISLVAVCVFSLAGTAPASGQAADAGGSQGAEPSYRVGTITVKFVGTANVNEQVVRANIQVHEGGEFTDSMLDRDIRNLYTTGLFEFIQIKRQAIDERDYNLVIEVTPKFRVLAVRYEGNKKVRTARLEKETKTRPNTALDERQVKEDSEKIREYYQKEGFNQVSVTYKIERDRASGFGSIVFRIIEGPKVKIKEVRFVGNAHIKSKALRGEMDTKRWWFLSWLMGTGRFKDDDFSDDLDKLRDYYREHGYLDVDIPEDKVVFDYPRPDRLILVIHVSEGRQYRIGRITFSGNRLHSSVLLRRVVRQKSGAVFAPSLLDADAQRLEDFYGKDGYLDTHVQLVRQPNIATGNIDIEYKINESDKYNVESIVVEGNVKTKSIVIIRELALGPGDVFDTVRMKISKLRLENTRFFDDVETGSQDTNIPGRRNLRVTVKEGRTGSLTFGVGYSTLERTTAYVELSQSNFDLFNARSMFQGDGEKFRVRLQVGSVSNEALINYEKPWLFERNLTLGFSIYRQVSDYISNYYSQVNLGGQVYLRKHLFELIDAQMSYTYQVIEIRDVSASASQVIQSAQGDNNESSVGLQLQRDTRDKILNTTTGNSIVLNTSLAGGVLGGKNEYYSVEFRGSQFFELFKAQEQVISLLARGGVKFTYGDTHVLPYYDGWYLGGPDDLRGFAFHEVSPRDQYGEPIGGKTYALYSVEYSLDIVSPIRFAMFYDAGYVNKGSLDFSPRNLSDDAGVGVRLFVMGAPLDLDYGIPLRGEPLSKQGGQFNFSFGTRF